MTDHLVVRPDNGWGTWEDFVRQSKVRFARKQLTLGSRLLTRTTFPEKSRVLKLSDVHHVSSVSESLRHKWVDEEAVHPILLIALAAGIAYAPGDSIFHHTQKDVAVSPYILTDEMGREYIFLLRNDGRHFTGEFQPLFDGYYLPRCTQVWGYTPDKEPDHELADHMFRPQKDGKYGRHCS